MIYNFLEDFCQMSTTMYTCGERQEHGETIKVPLARPYKNDVKISDVLGSFNKFNWLFKNNRYGNTLAEITLKARSYAHGTIEYNEIKEQLPGYTWCGTVKMVEDYDYDNQQFYTKRARRCVENIVPNGLVCLEFDDINHDEIDDYINKIRNKFKHVIYAGRTLSDSLFVMHRADSNLTNENFIEYFMTLAVMYYNEIGITCDSGCSDISRMRYICDQMGKHVASMTYCDFSPIENIKIEYDKIFKSKKNDSCVRRANNYEPTPDETIYDYDETKGFYYGHMKQHLHRMGELIVSVPSIEQIINTLIALGKSCDEIIELWKSSLKYYNYRTNSDNIDDNIRLTEKISKDDREFTVGNQTYTFLCMFFPKIIGIRSFFLDEQEFLCDRYYDMLVDGITRYNRILVHGDTGIGKTHFINKIGETKDVIVIVPYIAHMGNYPNFEQVEIKKENQLLTSGVVIWDRFVKLYNMGLVSDKSIIIIDESHKLFLDQNYREAAVNMNLILSEIKNKICYMSATPINEIDVDITYRFEKQRNKVTIKHFKIVPDEQTEYVNSSLTVNAILHLLYGNINYYDRIFIASDRYAQKIYDRLYGRFDCQLIRASQKDSEEFRKLMASQTLEHKIIIGTCISYESLNFNNRNEKILTITDMNEKTTAETITQIAGRVRFSYNLVYLVESLIKVNEDNYHDTADYYDKLESIKSHYNIYTKKHYVQKHAEELEKVKEWYFENNNIETIKNNLPMYISWTENEILASQISDKSPLNEQVKKYIIDYISNHMDENFGDIALVINGDTATYDFFGIDYINIVENGQAGYIIQGNIHDIQYSYRKLCNYVDFSKVNELIVEGHKLPTGVNKEIFDIIDIIKLSTDNYEHYIAELETYLNTLGGNYYFMLDRQIKHIKKSRKSYYSCIDDNEYQTYKNVFDKYLKNKTAAYIKKCEKNRENGKIGKTVVITDKMSQSKLNKYGLKVGDVFESCAALADKCHININTVTRWIKGKIVTEQ